MSGYLKKVFYILKASKSSLFFLLAAFTFSSILEAIGVGMILPYLRIAAEPGIIQENTLLRGVSSFLGLQEPNEFIALLGLIIIFLVCIKSFSFFDINARIISFGYEQKKILVSKLMSTYLRVPYTFHLSRNTANLIKNISYETDLFASLCLIPLLQTFANSIVVLALLILLAKVDAVLLATVLAFMLPLLIFFARFSKAYKIWGQTVSEARQDIIKTLNHSLGGIKETRIIGCESYFEEEMDRHSVELENATVKTQSFLLLPRILVEASLIISVVATVLFSQLFFQSSYQDLVPSLSVFAVASIRLIPSASQFLQAISKMRNGSYALNMLYKDLKELELYNGNLGYESSGLSKRLNDRKSLDFRPKKLSFRNEISLDKIKYTYPKGESSAIDHISLKIKKGQSVAFIGKSGAGKTTLADIILGLLTPEEGDIKVDGTSIYQNVRLWQNLIGYIPQSIFLLDDSIENNIAFGVPKDLIDHQHLSEVIKLAQLNELVDDLPLGIHTSVGERGVRLSGGQRQRIGIARALYHQREILVLDEATSALDNETELLISEAIDSLAGNITIIVIAHRLSTIQNCDWIFVMERGKILNYGNYAEIVGSKPSLTAS